MRERNLKPKLETVVEERSEADASKAGGGQSTKRPGYPSEL